MGTLCILFDSCLLAQGLEVQIAPTLNNHTPLKGLEKTKNETSQESSPGKNDRLSVWSSQTKLFGSGSREKYFEIQILGYANIMWNKMF